MYNLKEDSYRVEGNSLYREIDGDVILKPALLVYKGVLLRVGEYNVLFKEMLDLEALESQNRHESDGIHFQLLNLVKYPLDYFDWDDRCYVIRRCSEFIDSDFTIKFIDKYGNIGFFEWFEEEKYKFPLQTSLKR